MDPSLLPTLLGAAVLIPLVSFFVILLAGNKMGRGGQHAAWVAVFAIGSAAVLSFVSLGIWLVHHFPGGDHHGSDHGAEKHAQVASTRMVLGQNPAPQHASQPEAPKTRHAGQRSLAAAAVATGGHGSAMEHAAALP